MFDLPGPVADNRRSAFRKIERAGCARVRPPPAVRSDERDSHLNGQRTVDRRRQERQGFGSRVLDGILRSRLAGKESIALAALGVVFERQMPLKPGSQSADAASASHAD